MYRVQGFRPEGFSRAFVQGQGFRVEIAYKHLKEQKPQTQRDP